MKDYQDYTPEHPVLYWDRGRKAWTEAKLAEVVGWYKEPGNILVGTVLDAKSDQAISMVPLDAEEFMFTYILRAMRERMSCGEDREFIDGLIRVIVEENADFIFPPAAWAAFKKFMGW